MTISELEYKFTKREVAAIKNYAVGALSSRELGKIFGCSHTQAITRAGRYFIQEYKRANTW